MGTRQINVGLLSLALALGAVACGDDEDKAPPARDGGNSFTDEDADTEEEDASRPDGSRPDSGTPRQDAGAEEDGGGDTPDGGESCEASKAEADDKDWVEGCYKCAPETSEQLLNSCATGWRTFDPDQYPNGWQPGEDLPALP